jgi:hypothetical protein
MIEFQLSTFNFQEEMDPSAMTDEWAVCALFDELLALPFLRRDPAGNVMGPHTSPAGLASLHYDSGANDHRLYLAQSEEFYGDTSAEHRAPAENVFRRQFETLVEDLTRSWGQPAYLSLAFQATLDRWAQVPDAGDRGLTTELCWAGARALAYWCKGERVAYVSLEQLAENLPFLLVLGVAAIAGSRTACDS